jgi:HK97 gp10 family phage protein
MAGFAVTRNTIEAEVAKLKQQFGVGVGKLTHAAFDASQANCPVETGALKASGVVETTPDGQGTIRYTKDYAPYVEFGTSRMPAKLFLTGAVSSVEPRAGDIIAGGMR